MERGVNRNMSVITKGTKIPENVSDVILTWKKQSGTWYYNCKLGKGSFDVKEVVRPGYGVLFFQKKYHERQLGYWLDETTDENGIPVLAVRICEFNIGAIKNGETRTWTNEFDGYIIEKNGNTYSKYSYDTGSELFNMIDMYASQSEKLPEYIYLKISGYTQNVLENFFKEKGFVKGADAQSFASPYSLENLVGYKIPTPPVKKQEEVDKLTSKKIPTIKNIRTIKKQMFDVLKNIIIGKNKEIDKYHICWNTLYDAEMNFGIVQKIEEGIAVIRLFNVRADKRRLDIHNLSTIKSIKDIYVFEYARTYVTKDSTITCRNMFGKWIYTKNGNKNNGFRAIIIPWDDDEVKGTKMAYFNSIREGAIEAMKKDVEQVKEHKTSSYYLYTNSMEIGMNLHAMLESPLFESFINSGLDSLIEMIMVRIRFNSPKKILSFILGDDIDIKQNSYLKAAKVPAYMLKYINEQTKQILDGNSKYNGEALRDVYFYNIAQKAAVFIVILKNWLESYPDYLSHMDRKSFENNFDAYMMSNFTTSLMECIKNMVKLYGPKNIDVKINWINNELQNLKSSDHNEYSYYSQSAERYFLDYIEMCSKMNLENMPWKFKSFDDVKRAHDQVVDIYNIFRDEAIAKASQEKFDKVSKKWDKLTYDANNFCIIAPKSVSDITQEGITLHHCVRTYIEEVLNGRTNILFVRKKDEIDKPFYTLEIKSNAIRQCHGFGNCNVSEAPGLDDFLKEYCEAKNIEYTDGHRILAVGWR